MKLLEPIIAHATELTAIRRDIHAHPELSFEEFRTSDRVAKKLTEWGIEVHRGLGGTGVVGTLKRGESTRSIGLRADMDALPITERNQFEHRSQHPGRMHACGHDGHTAMLLAGAHYLANHCDFDGIVHFIFQPAEEGGGGARAMMNDGLFSHFPCDAVFALHNWPGLKVGEFALKPGPIMASINTFDITITGKGAHAAMPHLGVDPVLVACHIGAALQSLVSRNLDPVDTGVVSITMIQAGEAVNVIPDTAFLKGTVRAFKSEVVNLIESGMRRLVEHLAVGFGATATVVFEHDYPATYNDSEQAEFAAKVLDNVVGSHNIQRKHEPSMAGEDFSYMLQEVPGAYIWIGNGGGSHRVAGHGMGPCMLHNPSYDFNDELIALGGTFWGRLVEEFLPQINHGKKKA